MNSKDKILASMLESFRDIAGDTLPGGKWEFHYMKKKENNYLLNYSYNGVENSAFITYDKVLTIDTSNELLEKFLLEMSNNAFEDDW